MWPTKLSFALAFLFMLPPPGHSAESLAERLRKVEVKQYATAPGYSEGPSWRNGELFFCANGLMRVEKDGRVAKYLDINPAGTVLRGNGHLLICDNKHRAILDLAPDGVLNVVADQCDGKPLRSLNDLTVDARGNVYWTDPEGSTLQKPVGRIFRVTPKGVVSQIADGLAFPNGLEVDPQSKFLYLIESQSKKILRYELPADDKPLGKPTLFYDLGGSGGDGCVFDADGNFWVADYQRPETKHGRITVLSPDAKVLGYLDIPAKVVSNVTFGGPKGDELFCTTGTPDGVFHAQVGVKGFAGHPAKELKMQRRLPVRPEEPASAVHPRRFGLPGGIGQTRGWYIWDKWDPQTWQAEVRHEGTGEKYKVRVLPWATTYRHLVYGAYPGDLLPGERVNLFFNPDEKQQRAYLVHFQDELGQMKGHNHAWHVETVTTNGFTARVLAGDKPLDDHIPTFVLDPSCRFYRGGKRVESAGLARGDRLYLTWVYDGNRRVVKWLADAASLDAVQAEAKKRIAAQIRRDGLTGFVEDVANGKAHVLLFATYWAQAGSWKQGDILQVQGTDAALRAAGARVEARLLSRKNLGTYGSGASELVVDGLGLNEALVRGWVGGKVVRLFVSTPGAPKEKPAVVEPILKPLLRTLDLSIGETQEVELSNGKKVTVKLLGLNEERDSLRGAVRKATVTVEVSGKKVSLVSANYRLPVTSGSVQIDCPVTRGYRQNTSKGVGGDDPWGLDKDARLRLWPAGSPLLKPGTFLYPAKQRWFASGTQMANEPVHVDGGENALVKQIYYHYGLDMGGAEGMVEVVAATAGLVVSSGKAVLPGYADSPVQPRYDVVYVLDARGWYYRYSHLHTIGPDIKPGVKLKMGQRIGLLGKEGGSGGWSHLHFDIFGRQPSGKWGVIEGYAFLWEAYLREHKPKLIAVARPHLLAAVGEKVMLDGNRSWSADGKIKSYDWTFGDGKTAAGALVERTYTRPGVYSEILKITDEAGRIDYDFAVVNVLDKEHPDRLPPSIHAAYSPTFGIKAGEPVTFLVRTFRTTDGKETWDFGDGSPKVVVQSDGNVVKLAKDGYARTVHAFAKPGHYLVRVSRTDRRGYTAIAHLQVRVGVE